MDCLFMSFLVFRSFEALLLARVLVNALRVAACKTVRGDDTVAFESRLVGERPTLAA